MDEKSTANFPMSTEGCSSSGSNRNIVAPVEILNNRLDVLEQEAENMKKMLLVCMDERRKTISEILQLFQTLCTDLYGSEAKHPLSFHKEPRHQNIGLLQALCEDSNPFLVLRYSTMTNSLSQFYKKQCVEAT